jgi:hypothetical protein
MESEGSEVRAALQLLNTVSEVKEGNQLTDWSFQFWRIHSHQLPGERLFEKCCFRHLSIA